MSTLPEYGMRVRTAAQIAPAHKCSAFFVKPRHIEARRPSAEGHYKGAVPGAGGDLWWVEHDDGQIGAYVYDEVIVPEKVVVTEVDKL